MPPNFPRKNCFFPSPHPSSGRQSLTELLRVNIPGVPESPEPLNAEPMVAKTASGELKRNIYPLAKWGMEQLRAYKGDFATGTSGLMRKDGKIRRGSSPSTCPLRVTSHLYGHHLHFRPFLRVASMFSGRYLHSLVRKGRIMCKKAGNRTYFRRTGRNMCENGCFCTYLG